MLLFSLANEVTAMTVDMYECLSFSAGQGVVDYCVEWGQADCENCSATTFTCERDDGPVVVTDVGIELYNESWKVLANCPSGHCPVSYNSTLTPQNLTTNLTTTLGGTVTVTYSARIEGGLSFLVAGMTGEAGVSVAGTTTVSCSDTVMAGPGPFQPCEWKTFRMWSKATGGKSGKITSTWKYASSVVPAPQGPANNPGQCSRAGTVSYKILGSDDSTFSGTVCRSVGGLEVDQQGFCPPAAPTADPTSDKYK